MFDSCKQKQKQVLDDFQGQTDPQKKYDKILELGRKLAPFPEELKTQENCVIGCQSTMYLHVKADQDKLYFSAFSDALISSGLAALMIKVYSGESPETILKCPPNFIDELGLTTSLSPNRANGLYSIHLKMKQYALQFLTT